MLTAVLLLTGCRTAAQAQDGRACLSATALIDGDVWTADSAAVDVQAPVQVRAWSEEWGLLLVFDESNEILHAQLFTQDRNACETTTLDGRLRSPGDTLFGSFAFRALCPNRDDEIGVRSGRLRRNISDCRR